MRRGAAALAAGLALAACGGGGSPAGRVIIDLNRTTSAPMTLTSVVAEGAVCAAVSANADGAYVFATDSLPSGIYVAAWDSAHRLPLVVCQGRTQRVLGTWQEWDALAASDADTRAVIVAEGLRKELTQAADSAIASASLATAAGRRAVADSLLSLRQAARLRADALLQSLPDTSLAAVALMGLPGVYDDVGDHELLSRRFGLLASRHPRVEALSARSAQLGRVARLLGLRHRLGGGADAPRFAFVGERGDTLGNDDLARRRYVVALLPDSAEAVRAAELLAFHAADGRRVLVEAAANVALPRRAALVRGRFVRLDSRADLLDFAPAVVVVDADGGVAELLLGKNCK